MNITPKLISNQRRIGLTGGIATGKSTITDYIKTYKKIPILDADNLSKELIKPNTIGYKKILDNFGNQIIDKDSSEKQINRKLLKKIIFKDEKNKLVSPYEFFTENGKDYFKIKDKKKISFNTRW